MSDNSANTLRQQIDADLQRLQTTTLSLKARRNALAPIFHLPPETIALIFAFVVSLSYPRRQDEKRLTWMAIAHVCRQWRDIALQHPRLWTRIDFSSTDCAQQMLARAKMAPLQIEADFRPAQSRKTKINAMHLVLPHSSRAIDLRLFGPHYVLEKILQDLPPTAPVLERLGLHNDKVSFLEFPVSEFPISDNKPIRLPDNLFGGNAPNLYHLEVSKCDIRWSSPLFRTLRHLEIIDLSPISRPTRDQWLDALSNMPFIEELMLHDATPLFPMDCATIAAPDRVVTLPHLKSLDLSTEAMRIAHALNHLNLPSLRRVHADCTSTFESAVDVMAILPLFSKLCHGAHDPGPLKSLIFAGGHNMVKIIGFNEPDRDHPIDNPIALLAAVFTSRASLTVTATQTGWDFGAEAKIFENTTMTLPIKDIESFTAQDVERALFLSWRMCVPWRNLRRFTLVGGYLYTVADSLLKNTLDETDKMQIQPSPEDEESLSGLLFPQLTTLALIETDLLEDDLCMLFCDFIVARSELGLPIQDFVISRCEVDIDMVDRFRELVPTVTWDGREQGYSDDESDPFMGDDGLDDEDEEDDEDVPGLGGNHHMNIPDPILSMLMHGLGSLPPVL